MKFNESPLAHKLLDGLKGIEIGGSSHNPFGIEGCVFVDYTAEKTLFKEEELRLCGEMRQVDVVAPAWSLPFEDGSLDYILSSHLIEHCFDTIGTIEEWFRILKPGGIIFMIVPDMRRTFDKDREMTTYQELKDRHSGVIPAPEFDTHEHYSCFVTESWLEICKGEGWRLSYLLDSDDKLIGNGHMVVLKK